MDELKHLSIHHTAVKLCDEIQKMESYKDLYNEIQVGLIIYAFWSKMLYTYFFFRN